MSYDRRGGGYQGNPNGGQYGRQGGGYRNRADGRGRGDQPMHQRSFVGKKRGRDDQEEDDPKKVFIQKLMTVADAAFGGQTRPENDETVSAIDDTVKLCKRDLLHKIHTTSELIDLLLECVTELSTKTPAYVLLIGLLHSEEADIGSQILAALTEQLSANLAGHSTAQHDRARLLLRLLACLPSVNMVHHSAVVQLMEDIVTKAVDVAKSGSDPAGHTWQPWADWLVYIVLAALPWSGGELLASCPAEMSRLNDAIEEYMGLRAVQSDIELRPFLEPIKEGDIAALSDSGGAAFLPQLWSAVQACASQADNPWRVDSIPNLREGTPLDGRLAVAQPHDLPAVSIPPAPPQPPAGSAAVMGYSNLNEQGQMDVDTANADEPAPTYAVRAAYLRQCFPPRGGIRLLAAEHTDGSRPAIERFVAEEYILDTLVAYEADRKQCVKVLTTGLPLNFPHAALLAEVLFSQLLRLPTSRLPAMAYNTIIVDLCKLPKFEFPRALSGCVRECFIRLGVIDPALTPRLLNFLAYHLSCFEFQWPWQRWETYLDEPASNPQRQFCVQLVTRLTRLSYWERVHQLLPPRFANLLGDHPPQTPLLPAEQQKPQQNTGGKQGEGQPAGGEGESEMQGVENGQGAGNEEDAAVAVEDVLAGEVLERVRAKETCENLLNWMQTRGVETAVGRGPQGSLHVLMRALLANGAKSASHLVVSLERYSYALSALLQACPDVSAAQQQLLQQAAEFYHAMPQKVLMVADRLLALKLVTAESAAHWTTSQALPAALASPEGYGDAWELLHYTLDRASTRVTETKEKIAKLAGDEHALRNKAKEAHNQAVRTWEQMSEHLESLREPATPPAPPANPGTAMQVETAGETDTANGKPGQSGAQDGQPPATDNSTNAATTSQALPPLPPQPAFQPLKPGELKPSLQVLQDPDLESEAQQDPRGRRLLAAVRESENRAMIETRKADQTLIQMQDLQNALPVFEQEARQAILATYQGLAALLTREEEQQQTEHEREGDMTSSEAQQATRVDLLYQQLTAFTRRYAVQTAAALPQLTSALAQQGLQLPTRLAAAIQQVLHAEIQ